MSLAACGRFRLISLVLCVCVLFNSTVFAAAPLDPATAKQQIQSQGVSSTVRLTRKDGTQLRGRIVTIGDDTCVLQVKKAPVTVPFADVAKVRDGGLSRGAKIGIGVGIFAAVVGITAAVLVHKFNTGFPKTIPI